MKKIVCFCLILTFVVGCFSGCGGPKWKPERVSDDLVPYVERAIEIIDQYLAFEITAEEATAEIADIAERIDAESMADYDNDYPEIDRIIAAFIDLWNRFGVDSDTDRELRKAKEIMLYSIGKRVSGSRDFVGEIEDFHTSLSVHYDYMCGYDPQDLVDDALEIYDALMSGEMENDGVYQWYMCYDQYVFWISQFYRDGKYVVNISGSGTLDDIEISYENPTLDEIESALIEVSSYFTGP